MFCYYNNCFQRTKIMNNFPFSENQLKKLQNKMSKGLSQVNSKVTETASNKDDMSNFSLSLQQHYEAPNKLVQKLKL